MSKPRNKRGQYLPQETEAERRAALVAQAQSECRAYRFCYRFESAIVVATQAPWFAFNPKRARSAP